jgi:threonine dehydrogenase-like Zn-dependent dehydrogenase
VSCQCRDKRPLAPEPGRVFDRTVDLDDVPDGYRAMANRESIKVMIKP